MRSLRLLDESDAGKGKIMRTLNTSRGIAYPLVVLWAMLLTLVGASRVEAQDIVNIWQARFSSFKGNLNCSYGSPACNRCVNNVIEQFKDLTQRPHARTVRKKKWEYEDDTTYSPANKTPNEVLTSLLWRGHFQGFVRIPFESGSPIYAASHSLKNHDKGAVFFSIGSSSSALKAPDGDLSQIVRSSLWHPGGMQAIGKYVLVANEADNPVPASLDVFDSTAVPVTRNNYPIPRIGTGAAAVSITQVAGGGYLLVFSESSYHNRYRIYYTSNLDSVILEQVYAHTVHADYDTGFTNGSDEQNSFESLSLVTECGTGKLYVIAATAPTLETEQSSGLYSDESVWVLFDLVQNSDVSLRYVTKNTLSMFSQECDPRASGTAFAGKNGELALYCHQKFKTDSARADATACVVSNLLGLGVIGAAFCTKLANVRGNIWFTEYWRTDPSTYPTVTVTVSGNSSGIVGVMEGHTGQVCERSGYATESCQWRFAPGTPIVLIPYGEQDWFATEWIGECAERNTLVRATECSRTVFGSMSFSLTAGKIL